MTSRIMVPSGDREGEANDRSPMTHQRRRTPSEKNSNAPPQSFPFNLKPVLAH